jgi:hypothetical protein
MDILFFLTAVAVIAAFGILANALVHPFFILFMLLIAVAAYFNARDVHLGADKILQYETSPLNQFAIVFLFIALLALGERALYDIARLFSGLDWNYFDNLETIIVQAMFVLPVFVAAIVINAAIGEKRQKYAIVLLPYLLVALALAMQLSGQITMYFYDHHTNIQLYAVMSLLILISSTAIYIIQSRMPLILEE